MVFKFWTFLKGFKRAAALFNSTRNICGTNATGCRAKKIKNRLQEIFKFCKWTAFFVNICILIFVAYPAKAFLVDGQYISLLPIKIMFIDQSTLSGFLTANVIMSIMGLMANIGTAYSILLIVNVISNYAIMVDGVEDDFKCLDEMWSGTSDTSVKYRHLFLRNICQKKQDMEKYF